MKGTFLKERIRPLAALQTLRERVGRIAGRAAGFFLSGLLLSALSLGGGPLPLAGFLVYCAALWADAAGALFGALCGYALFYGWSGAPEPWALCLSLFAASALLRRSARPDALVLGGVTLVVEGIFLLDSGFALAPLMRGAVWVLAATALPLALRRLPLLRSTDAPPQVREPPSLRPAQKVLENMYAALVRESPAPKPAQVAELFDYAAEQVCGCCVSRALCWEQNAEDTYRDLCAAGEAALLRGTALREDLPDRFQTRCRHTEGFLTAVNQALDKAALRQREVHRLAQGRQIAAVQYLLLARLIKSLDRPTVDAPVRFHPELAVGSATRAGCEISGDRGAACRDRFGRFYVLLCDGMGSGPAAREESDRAARSLSAFLELGMEADTAMALLNGFFQLRRTAVFSTVDLLRLDLQSGEGTLFKWGAAPSYLCRGQAVQKIGTATLPPGLEAGAADPPGQFALSLQEGETLVMVSDGAYGEETERRLAEMTGSVRDLASCLIAMGESDASDDRTVAVLRLHPEKPSKA